MPQISGDEPVTQQLRFYRPPHGPSIEIETIFKEVRRIASWAVPEEAVWPSDGIFGEGFASRQFNRWVQEQFARWATERIIPNAVVIINIPIYYQHSET